MALAGLAVGVFGASAVWALAVPGPGAAGTTIPVLAESFEDGQAKTVPGLPRGLTDPDGDIWRGDEARVVMAMQEIVWQVKPDLIIECGIAHGGSILYYASLLELQGHGEVLGIDIDIRPHNRQAIEAHPMSKRVRMIEGSSIDAEIAGQVRALAEGKKVILVLDSNHTHEHVLKELELYAPLVAVGSYCVVMDTVVEDLPADFFPDRPWGPGDNPKTAVWEYLKGNDSFEIDYQLQNKLLVTVAPDGYLRRVR
jgi:cephalosporin hydroxylase